MFHDGGEAFPTDDYYDEQRVGQSKGMSLRDYIAAKALVGMLSSRGKDDLAPQSPADDAMQAYVYADHMLAARRSTMKNSITCFGQRRGSK